MAKCNFDWSMCATCACSGSNLCPLENNRTIKELQHKIKNLKNEMDNLMADIGDLKDRIET